MSWKIKLEDVTWVSDNVVRVDTEYWHLYYDTRYEEEPEITGKYLFYSEDKRVLEEIAIEELENGSFFHAKINTDSNKKGREYVLCLYDRDDRRKHELARKYGKRPGLKYRYWKSDKDTLEGKYSEEFLSQLSPEERARYERKKRS